MPDDAAAAPSDALPWPALPPAPPWALRADLIDFVAEPSFDDPASDAVRVRPAHWLVVGADGRIAEVRPGTAPTHVPTFDAGDRWLLPGFVDTHVHAPQLPVVGAWGASLLDWLRDHTFPAEAAWADAAHAHAMAGGFLDALTAHGTTAACVWPTVHAHGVDALAAAALARGMRIVTGKVLMDRHAPAALRDAADVDAVERTVVDQIERWQGRGRVGMALTPRFAPTSTPAQLAMVGRLLSRRPDLWLQTHVAETRHEVAWVAQLFPEARSYLDVYADAGLLSRRALFAHGLWLDDADRARLAQAGASLVHCPTSNLFLGSGLLDADAVRRAGLRMTVATDVGGGTTLAMLPTLAAAYQVQALQGRHPTAWWLLDAATRAAADAMDLGGEFGRLEPGRVADVALWSPAVGRLARERDAVARQRAAGLAAAPAAAWHERVFPWVIAGDDRNLLQCWVAGRPRGPALPPTP